MKRMVRNILFIFLFIFTLTPLSVNAYQLNGWHISTPLSIPFYCSATSYSTQVSTYAKKWNNCSELYLYEGNSATAYIT